MNIDVRTILIAHSLQNIVLTIIMGLAYAQNRKTISGPETWFAGSLCYLAGLVLVAIRGFIPDILSFEFANLMLLLGALAVPFGTTRFFGGKPFFRVSLAALVGAEAAYVWFMRVSPDITIRILLLSVFVAAAYTAAAIRSGIASRREPNRPAEVAALFFALAAAVNILRLVLYFSFSRGMNVFDPRSMDTFYFLFSLIVLPGVTFSQLQLISGRLSADLLRAVNERGILVKEMNHRVKNSLAMAEGLIALQCGKMEDGHCAAVMARVRSRIHSISLVHELLNKTDAAGRLRIDRYLADLTRDITESVPRFAVTTEFPPLELDSGVTVSLGILVNELLTNAIKYAAGSNGFGSAIVQLVETPDGLTLRVKDSGPGFRIDGLKGLGTELVDAMADQLNGSVRRFNNGGAVVEVTMPFSCAVRGSRARNGESTELV